MKPFLIERKQRRSLSISTLKGKLPPNILDYSFGEVRIIIEDSFPYFIFQFKTLQKLTLILKDKVVFPKDWKNSNGIKSLFVQKWTPRIDLKPNIPFSNLDFINTIPGLENITIERFEIPHPDFLFKNYRNGVTVNYKNITFSSLEGYTFENTFVSSSDLGFIPLLDSPLDEKRRLLSKAIDLRKEDSQLKIFTRNQLTQLLKKIPKDSFWTKDKIKKEIENRKNNNSSTKK